MELKDIQTLVKLVSSSKVDEVDIEKKDFKIKIRKNKPKTTTVTAAQAVGPQVVAAPAPQLAAAPAATESEPEAAAPATSNTVDIKSPMIGTFYRKSAPEKPSFIEVGDTVEKGQVICIIEAMKLFNEIESEVSGKIVKVLVDDSQPVEYDQPLFIVEPS